MNSLRFTFFALFLIFNFALASSAKEYVVSLSEVSRDSLAPRAQLSWRFAFSLQKSRESFYASQLKPDEVKNLKVEKVLFAGRTREGAFESFKAFVWGGVSEEDAAIREAIKAKGENFGDTTKISVLSADKEAFKVKFLLSRKIPEIRVEKNWFSPDECLVNTLEESGFAELELERGCAILIEVENLSKVLDSTPFWGDIPLIGPLFQSAAETRQTARYLLLKVSEYKQGKLEVPRIENIPNAKLDEANEPRID